MALVLFGVVGFVVAVDVFALGVVVTAPVAVPAAEVAWERLLCGMTTFLHSLAVRHSVFTSGPLAGAGTALASMQYRFG